MLLSTHILQEVEAVAQRVLLIHNGRLCFDGTPEELRGSGTLEESFYNLTGNNINKTCDVGIEAEGGSCEN